MINASSVHAKTFRQIHAPRRMLRLANAWDAGSARLIESCGAPAIATMGAGLAWARGYADGNFLPARVLAAAIAEITRILSVALSVLVVRGLAPVAELQRFGVRRVSAGPAILRAAYGVAHRAATQLLDEGRYDAMSDRLTDYGEMNRLFA